MDKKTILTQEQFYSRLRAIENKQLKLYKKSTSATFQKMYECIVATHNNQIEIDTDKYNTLRKLCLTEDFVNNYQKYFSNTKFITTIK